MSNFFQMILSTFLLLPYLVFVLLFFIINKLIRKPKRAFGVAADITTFILFLAVPIAIEALFEVKTMIYFFCFALVISVLLTIQEWKTRKEIELVPLLRKIWRFLFLLLSLCYLLVFCLGLLFKIMQYLK
ncbi:MAG: DUF3397 family protein [Paenisporosarcina sp.]